MSVLKYCVPFGVSKLILYGFSTDSLRICGRFTHKMSLHPQTDPNSVSNASFGVGLPWSPPAIVYIYIYNYIL